MVTVLVQLASQVLDPDVVCFETSARCSRSARHSWTGCSPPFLPHTLTHSEVLVLETTWQLAYPCGLGMWLGDLGAAYDVSYVAHAKQPLSFLTARGDIRFGVGV